MIDINIISLRQNIYVIATYFSDVDLNLILLKDNDTGESILLDSGTAELAPKIAELVGIPKSVYISHAHYDHAGGTEFFAKNGAKIYASRITSLLLENETSAVESFFPSHYRGYFDPGYAEAFAQEIVRQSTIHLDTISIPTKSIKENKIKVLDAPGHVNGMQVYLIDNVLFSSDAIQGNGIKGTKTTNAIPQISSFNNYFHTVNYIIRLSPEIIVPGHNFGPANSRIIEGSKVDQFLHASLETAQRILDYAYDALNEDWQSLGSLTRYILNKWNIDRLYPQALITTEAVIKHMIGDLCVIKEGNVILYKLCG